MRYTLTKDGNLVVWSETGLVDFGEWQFAERSRLGPGEMIIAKPDAGTFLRWRDILKRLGGHQSKFASPRVRRLDTSAPATIVPVASPKRVAASCGWTEDQRKILFSALIHGKEADWSMGDDAPPAFLSALPRTLWDYCKQRFAQVTNPPIDPLRETHVMSLEVRLPANASAAGGGIVLPGPILTQGEFADLAAQFRPLQTIAFTLPPTLAVSGALSVIAHSSPT